MLHDLVPLDSQRRDLFDVAASFEARRRWERLSVLADLLHARYGRDMLSLGPSVEPPGGYAGAKIAFNRIPEDGDFEVDPIGLTIQKAGMGGLWTFGTACDIDAF